MARDTNGTQQVGFGGFSNGYRHALLWSGTAASAIDLTPIGYDISDAMAISGNQQVGYGWGPAAGPGNYEHALLWSGTAASAVDLPP